MKPGTQIVYVPSHVGKPDDESVYGERGVEFGFVTSQTSLDVVANKRLVFCRYWSSLATAGEELRTMANSEATPADRIAEFESVEQTVVNDWMRRLGYCSYVA